MKFDYEELRSLLLNTNYYLAKYRKNMKETEIKMYLAMIEKIKKEMEK